MHLGKRSWIYAGLLAFVGGGAIIDSIWRTHLYSYTWNDLVQMVGIILLTAWWQIEDARLRDVKRGVAARILTVLLVPVGLAVYLYQSGRPPMRATLVLAGYIAGFFLAASAGLLVGDEILRLWRQG
ncbi:hypothetical protein [Aquamicrobium sp. LC103]|uniref:hypothetical protein n=1 Tax=Aquamicrobium sp. LC103 TaxID=1120658 RepID=UPI00063EA1B0|nr:hypothetical protein [Aquamicrobium sp. LC103]TKT79099.1 hypothetical protein XW59_009185 [Aquamicrobium sp. LC103]